MEPLTTFMFPLLRWFAPSKIDPVYDKRSVERALTASFKNRYVRKDVVLTGLLLARPEDPLTKRDILPHLKYWHHRSDYHTDFFCAGYGPQSLFRDSEPIGVTISGRDWGFCHRAFVEIVEGIEDLTDWKYKGDPMLLLLNAYFDGSGAHLDYNKGLRINFREAVKKQSTETPTAIAEAIFEFAKNVNEDSSDPIWEFSDQAGRRVLKKGMKAALLSWFPKWLSSSVEEAFQYAVYEISRKSANN